MNNAKRRREKRDSKKRIPVLIAGEGIVASTLGYKYEARPHAELPPKLYGKHRWIAAGSWVLSESAVAAAHDPDTMKFLDNENLFSLSIGCWDCEQPLGVISPESFCSAEAHNA